MSLVVSAVGLLFAVQATQATVVGTVRNADTGEPVARATVAMPDLGRAAVSDSGGRYQLYEVPSGPQHVTVRAIGYGPRTLHALVPRTGRLEIAVSLAPMPYRLAVVDVRPAIPMRGASDDHAVPFPDRSISIAAVRTHPLFSEPDAFQALGGGEVVVRPEAPSGMHIRGGSADQTAFTLDGVPVISPYHAAGMFSAWNPDALSVIGVSIVPATGPVHALAGTVAATTRVPGRSARTRGSVSNTQSRITLDGPVGRAGYLVSVRGGPPSLPRRNETSYLRGEAHDWIATFEVPVRGGTVRLLGYENDNEITSATAAAFGDAQSGPQRNAFEWYGRSLGAEWRGTALGSAIRVSTWRATGSAGIRWGGLQSMPGLSAASRRTDAGLEASVARDMLGGPTTGGVRLERTNTAYHLERDTQPDKPWRLATRTPVATLFAGHTRGVTRRLRLEVGAVAAAAAGEMRLGPHARLQWNERGKLSLSTRYARLHQFAQSVRNAESVTGTIFPADLFVGFGAAGMPIGRSDVAIVAAEFRPLPGARIGLQLHDRAAEGVALVAPREATPFATGPFAVGAATSRGVAAEIAVATTHLGVLLNYGAQRVRHRYGDSSFVPEHGTTHLLEGGTTVFPTRTSSIRLGVASGWGRRGTPLSGGFEWESCNLRDRGCEFAGSPQAQSGALGASRLPPYVRVDLGVRKHWHVGVGTRDVELALFGAMTNILNRRNVLAYVANPSAGQPGEIEMRPQAPLVIGLDWRF